jgi:hypothetical protein
MAEAVVRHFEAEVIADPYEAALQLRSAVDEAKQAMGAFRNEDGRMRIIGEFELSLQNHLSQHPSVPREDPDVLSDDFDGAVRLPLYPQVGRFRPTGSEAEERDWAEQLRELRRRDAFIPGAGIDGSVGLEIRSLGRSELVSCFCPLAARPDREVKVTFWSKAELKSPATAGLAVVEFDFNFVTYEQIPDYMFKNRVLAVRPITRDTSGEWEESSLTFRTTPDTRMMHLVLFLGLASTKDRVVFDNVTIAYGR